LAFLARRFFGNLGALGKDFSDFGRTLPMLAKYPDDVEQAMRFTFNSLNERQRRLYAATEAVKLGRGGVTYLSRLFDCDRNTIYRGLEELNQPSLPLNQARKKGVAAVDA
jgi:hypothetical protein